MVWSLLLRAGLHWVPCCGLLASVPGSASSQFPPPHLQQLPCPGSHHPRQAPPSSSHCPVPSKYLVQVLSSHLFPCQTTHPSPHHLSLSPSSHPSPVTLSLSHHPSPDPSRCLIPVPMSLHRVSPAPQCPFSFNDLRQGKVCGSFFGKRTADARLVPPSLGSAGGIEWHQLLNVPCSMAGHVCEWGISGFPLQGNGSGTGHKGWRGVGMEHTWKHTSPGKRR